MIAGVMLGCLPLAEMRKRIEILESIISGLCRMRSELSTYGMSIPNLMALMKNENMFSSVRDCLERNGPMSFSDSWKAYIKEFGYALTAEENRVVSSLGDVLGQYAMTEQLESLRTVIELLEHGKVETRNKLRSVSRLYVGTSLSLSAMLVVLLI